jgi:predicted DNA-binding ribbon-helix-helix protein
METESLRPTDRLHQSAETRLKILQQQGEKLAIRLEAIFWSQLTDFAKEEQTTLSKLVFRILKTAPALSNKTSHLRCYCIDKLRKKQPLSALLGPAFDMLAFVSTCPTPVTIVTDERRIVALNPAFSAIIRDMASASRDRRREISLSFSEPFSKIQEHLVQHPTDIKVYHLGLQVGDGPAQQFRARFALAERAKGKSSLVAIFLER